MMWFTSDLHFGHNNVIKHCNRPFKDKTEMEESIIEDWNKKVKRREMVWVLGDWSFYGIQKTKEITSRLNGDIRIVRGNHDKYAAQLLSMGFTNVYENHRIELVKDFWVNLSHFPYHPLKNDLQEYDRRYLHKRIVDDGRWLLHGHTHSNQKISLINGKQFHVGWDAWHGLVSAREIYSLIMEVDKDGATRQEGTSQKDTSVEV